MRDADLILKSGVQIFVLVNWGQWQQFHWAYRRSFS